MKRMNEAIALNNNVRHMPMASSEPHELSFLGRIFYNLGVTDMAPSTKPPGFFVNWTTVTGIIVVLTTIAGLWWFTYQTAQQAGYQQGRADAEKLRLEKELEATKQRLFVIEEKQKMEDK